MNTWDAATLMAAIQEATRFHPSKWERDFLDSIEEQIEADQGLSDRQSKSLQEIYRKSQGG